MKKIRILIIMFLCIVTVIILHGSINFIMLCRNAGDMVISDVIRDIKMDKNEMKKIYKTDTTREGIAYITGVNVPVLESITYEMMYKVLCQNGNVNQGNEKSEENPPYLFKVLVDEKLYEEIYRNYLTIFNDIKLFPVPEDMKNKVETPYENSWAAVREYVGKTTEDNVNAENSTRKHEGTDIMAGNNEAGYFPVISMTDGVVEKKGWLELGGYRIGIRSPGGAYFYYAHLANYAEGIEEGSEVRAGDIIGVMGDSGYGEEGTTGKFDVHLHLGIYTNHTDDDGNAKEISYNPYYILKSVEKFKKDFVDNDR